MSDKNKPDNLIPFPTLHTRAPVSQEDMQQRLREYKESYSTELAEIIWENVLGEMARAGCDLDENIEKYFPNMILIFESIKALHLLTMNVSHPLHKFAEKNVLLMDTAEHEGVIAGGFKKNIDETVDFDPEMD